MHYRKSGPVVNELDPKLYDAASHGIETAQGVMFLLSFLTDFNYSKKKIGLVIPMYSVVPDILRSGPYCLHISTPMDQVRLG